MKVLKIAGMSMLAFGLVLGMAFPVLASGLASPQTSNISPEVLRGRVVSIDEELFVIQSGEQKLVISVNDGTKYFKLYVPGRLVALVRHRMQLMQPEVQQEIRVIEPEINQVPQLKDREILKHQRPNLKRLRFFGEEATFSDITISALVAVRAVWEEDTYLAKIVIIIKPTTYARVIGTVFNIDEAAMEITIEPLSSSSAENGEITLAYDSHTVFILRGNPGLQEGEKVVAIYMEKEDGTLLAKRVMSGAEPLELAQ